METYELFQQRKGELQRVGELKAENGNEALEKAKKLPKFLMARGLAHWPIIGEKPDEKKQESLIDKLVTEMQKAAGWDEKEAVDLKQRIRKARVLH